MPRSRGSDLPQRQSPRGPHQLRTSSSDSDPLHHRPIADRSPKLGDRRSPRGTTQSDNTLNQKKLGTRIADLESQLGQAQQELKNLKDQLASAEAAKKEAQEKLVKKADQSVVPVVENAGESNETESNETENKPQDIIVPDEIENHKETDVFEVIPIEKVAIEFTKPANAIDQMEKEAQPLEDSITPAAAPKPEKKPCVDEVTLKNDEISLLKSSLEEKMKELESMSNENENLKKQLSEAVSEAETKEEGMTLHLKQLGEELEASKVNAEKLKRVEAEKEVLESEMKKLRVQTEQWRKAADAAAAVLAGDVDMMSARISERCGSMDKHFSGGTGTYETPIVGRYNGYVGSPGVADELDDGLGGGKKKGSGIRMFGDLWKKRGQK